MSTPDYIKIHDEIKLQVTETLASLGCQNPLVSMRLTDTDPEPEPGPYLDVVVSARILVEHYQIMHAQETPANPVDR